LRLAAFKYSGIPEVRVAAIPLGEGCSRERPARIAALEREVQELSSVEEAFTTRSSGASPCGSGAATCRFQNELENLVFDGWVVAVFGCSDTEGLVGAYEKFEVVRGSSHVEKRERERQMHLEECWR
jgi:hypothetical protein